MRLVVTIAAGEEIDYSHITVPRIYGYSRRVGADFWAITQPVFGSVRDFTNGVTGGPSMWKLPLIEWFSRQELYYSMLYIDADVFIPSKAGDAFADAHGPGIHMCPDMNDGRELPFWCAWRHKFYPHISLPKRADHYLNAGVWVIDKMTAFHIASAAQDVPCHTRWQEQDFLNLMAYHTGTARILPDKFNQPFPFQKPKPDDETGFFHLCGQPQGAKLKLLQQFQANDP